MTLPQPPEDFNNPPPPPGQQSYPPPPSGGGYPPSGGGYPPSGGGYPQSPDPYSAPPPPPPVPYGQPGASYGVDPYGRQLSDKSKITAGLLQFFLGGFGVGRFYLGYTNIGILQIVATVFTCGIGALWPLIDSIMIFTGQVPDAQGRPLRD